MVTLRFRIKSADFQPSCNLTAAFHPLSRDPFRIYVINMDFGSPTFFGDLQSIVRLLLENINSVIEPSCDCVDVTGKPRGPTSRNCPRESSVYTAGFFVVSPIPSSSKDVCFFKSFPVEYCIHVCEVTREPNITN